MLFFRKWLDLELTLSDMIETIGDENNGKSYIGENGYMCSKNGFGALPVQRVSLNEAKIILRKAYENGIQFFDSARAYSDSEEKLVWH